MEFLTQGVNTSPSLSIKGIGFKEKVVFFELTWGLQKLGLVLEKKIYPKLAKHVIFKPIKMIFDIKI